MFEKPTTGKQEAELKTEVYSLGTKKDLEVVHLSDEEKSLGPTELGKKLGITKGAASKAIKKGHYIPGYHREVPIPEELKALSVVELSGHLGIGEIRAQEILNKGMAFENTFSKRSDINSKSKLRTLSNVVREAYEGTLPNHVTFNQAGGVIERIYLLPEDNELSLTDLVKKYGIHDETASRAKERGYFRPQFRHEDRRKLHSKEVTGLDKEKIKYFRDIVSQATKTFFETTPTTIARDQLFVEWYKITNEAYLDIINASQNMGVGEDEIVLQNIALNSIRTSVRNISRQRYGSHQSRNKISDAEVRGLDDLLDLDKTSLSHLVSQIPDQDTRQQINMIIDKSFMVGKWVYYKYRNIVSNSYKIKQILPELTSEMDDTAKINLLHSVEDKLIRSFNRILESLSEKTKGELMELETVKNLSTVDVESLSFFTALKYCHENNLEVKFNEITNLDLKIETPNCLSSDEIGEMVSIYKSNYKDTPELKGALVSNFEEILESTDPRHLIHLVKYKGEDGYQHTAAFYRTKLLDDGSIYCGSFNVNPHYRGASLGERVLEASLDQLAKTSVIRADCTSTVAIVSNYIERGFLGVRHYNYENIPSLELVRNDKKRKDLLTSPHLTKEEIIALSSKTVSRIDNLVITSGPITEFDKICEENFKRSHDKITLLTRYFILDQTNGSDSQDKRVFYAVFETIPISTYQQLENTSATTQEKLKKVA